MVCTCSLAWSRWSFFSGWRGKVIPSLPNSMPLSSALATTGTLSMSSGSLFYLLFTSFHFSDDDLPILYHRVDMELNCSEFGYSFLRLLLDRLRATRETPLLRR